MFSSLAEIFDEFIENIANGNQWTYTFLGLILFIILLYSLINMVRR